jgi:hypothetical protein
METNPKMTNEATNEASKPKSKTETTYAGSCHCGAVQFRVTADLATGPAPVVATVRSAPRSRRRAGP